MDDLYFGAFFIEKIFSFELPVINQDIAPLIQLKMLLIDSPDKSTHTNTGRNKCSSILSPGRCVTTFLE